MFKLAKIEKEIICLKNEINSLPNKLWAPVSQNVLDGRVKKAKKPLLHKLEILKIEREFILSRRESWLPKSIWNIFVPLVISLITGYIVNKYFD